MTETAEDLDDLLQTMLENIVSDPSTIQVTSSQIQNTITFHVSVQQKELGKVIGKAGKNWEAIQHVVKIAARVRNIHVFFQLE